MIGLLGGTAPVEVSSREKKGRDRKAGMGDSMIDEIVDRDSVRRLEA